MAPENSIHAETKFKIELQYQGTGYCGWQIQPDQVTVQETLSGVLSHLAGRKISVTGAGRTDSGVHALQQVAHFHFPEKESIPNLKKTLNALLPWDIRVTSISKASPGFHARKSAIRKRYEFHLYTGEVFPPFLNNLAVHLNAGFNPGPAREAAPHILGTHDFSAFTGAGSAVKDKIRTVTVSEFREKGETLIYRIEANGFLLHMVRNIVGTLIDTGCGRIKPSDIPAILESRDRSRAGATAPPQGLYLARIWYENGENPD